MKKWTEEQIDLLKVLWGKYKAIEDLYYCQIGELEKMGLANLKVPIEFFFTDGGCVGIGDENREYELLQEEELNEDTNS